jgi:ribonuclease J
MFPQEGMLGVDLIVPDFTYLEARKEKVKAILITHGHEDHTGALPYILKRLNVPVYTGALTQGLINVKLREHGLQNTTTINMIEPGSKMTIGPFEIEFFRVCHSIPDAMGIAIKTPIGLIIHTGDFKIDYNPVDGHPTDFSVLSRISNEGVLLLMSDSTYAELPGFTPSETVVDTALENIISRAPGRVLVATFASLISRVQQIINIATSQGRSVAVIGRSLVNNTKMAIEMGYLKIPDQVLIPWDQLKSSSDRNIIVITTGAQGEPTSALVRMGKGEHRDINIQPNDTVILSSSPIPGNERLINQTVDNLLRHGANVFHSKNSLVHVHGHASQEELKIILRITKPKYFVPIHGEYHHLVAHSALASSMGVSKNNIFTLEDGQVLELSDENAGVVEKFSCGHVFVSRGYLWDASNTIFQERKHLSTSGIVIAIFPINKHTGKINAPPLLASTGVLNIENTPDILDLCSKELMGLVEGKNNLENASVNELQHYRRTIANSLFEQTGQLPVVQMVFVPN